MLNIILSFLFILFPLSLVGGVFFSNSIISILALYGLYQSLKKKNWFIYKDIIIKFFIFFYIYILLRSLYSIDPFFSLESSLTYIRYLFFALAVFFLIQENKKILKYFSISLSIVLLLVCLDSFYQYFFGVNILGWPQQDPVRVSSFFGKELVLGSFVSRLMPLSIIFLVIFLDTKKILNKFLIVLFIIILATTVFISGERTALFYFILSTVISIILVTKVRIYYLSSIIILISFAIIAFTINPNFKSRMINETINQMNISSNLQNVKVFSEHHERLYSSAIKMFQYNPFFGHGPKTFRILCKEPEFNPGACSTHPHNTYLQSLAEIGIFGTFFIILFLLYISVNLIKKLINTYFFRKVEINDSLKITILICMLISIWPLSPSANFFASWINGFYYLPLGFYFYEKFQNDNK